MLAAGVELAGGRHALFSNNIIGDNSIAGSNASSAVLVRSGVSDFIVANNHIGAVFNAQQSAQHRYGVEIEAGTSDRYVVANNLPNGIGRRLGVCQRDRGWHAQRRRATTGQ